MPQTGISSILPVPASLAKMLALRSHICWLQGPSKLLLLSVLGIVFLLQPYWENKGSQERQVMWYILTYSYGCLVSPGYPVLGSPAGLQSSACLCLLLLSSSY